MRGRKPTPTKLRLLRNNPGKRKPNKNEPKVDPALPPPPRHLSELEKSIWVGFAQELYNAGLLTNLDIGTFEIYVLAYATRVRVKPHLDNALIYKGPNGGAVHNPYLAIYNKATEQMLKSGAELGLSPGSRSRISVDPPKGEESPLQQWKQKYKA